MHPPGSNGLNGGASPAHGSPLGETVFRAHAVFYGAKGKFPGTQTLAVPAGAVALIITLPDPNRPGSFMRLAQIPIPIAGMARTEAAWLLALGDQLWADYRDGCLRATEPAPGIVCAQDSPLLGTIERFRGLAHYHWPFLVLGEKGVGKTALTREFHALSERGGPCNYVNCASFNSSEALAASMLFGLGSYSGLPGAPRSGTVGHVGRSDRGVLLLDECDMLPLSIQADLLTVVTGGEFRKVGGACEAVKVEVRFVFATNKDPNELVLNGKLLSELYDRINTVEIHIPPLRERRGDIPVLIDHFSKAQSRRVRFARDLFLAMLWHDWPDNVRGLQNLIQAASFWKGPDPLRLADLDKLSINSTITKALQLAYANYVSAANAGHLPPREEKIVNLISEISRSVFQRIFSRVGRVIGPPVPAWREVVNEGLETLRARLPAFGFEAAPLREANNCAQLLAACGLDKATIRRTLCLAFASLQSHHIPVSCQFEQPRYAALLTFFGLAHGRLRYSPRGRHRRF